MIWAATLCYFRSCLVIRCLVKGRAWTARLLKYLPPPRRTVSRHKLMAVYCLIRQFTQIWNGFLFGVVFAQRRFRNRSQCFLDNW